MSKLYFSGFTANEVAQLSGNLLKIAVRAKFKEFDKKELEDIDLVFNLSKLKNHNIDLKLQILIK